MSDSQVDIKSMQLYCNIDRIWNELRELGWSNESKEVIPVETMNKFDCYDYSGGEDLTNAFPSLHEGSHVLDVGSGLGGPARHLSSQTKCNVIGVELQEDVATLGNQLSQVCNIHDKVHIVAGDFTDPSVSLQPGPCQDSSYDAAFSILVILHIPMEARVSLFKRCFELLKPGGKLYIEDFFLQPCGGELLTDEEVRLMKDEISIPDANLPTREDYISQVESIGFSDVEFEDVTEAWTAFTSERLGVWCEQRERHERVHNEATWQSLHTFYSAVVTMFKSGKMGGVKLILTKK
mmetsp:Transcript_5905/g.9604  ORF Transcript_5905/g.9604 Transcript_5905/m.9604 type:complete len:293 (-) Transcript_5905:494-1372(-)|eukprot:CAMPEP_0114431622 /NCGR_PEP_ID=MMETSP0103-20121206/10709_1 /TAXON_ID=37642 ORGANISM="Paraphysomonas imperforata, Strain PA2" /NCGR_SAMPLE_ID=MMETSP0103 /ASSEMBLY_ACC=CAM_ASM_000201 /LENGTH=292 /DNA_ID=CAMNT_0001601221 /DNA_START=19 /DNA_END=897 /DNA_ORIENTATION=+